MEFWTRQQENLVGGWGTLRMFHPQQEGKIFFWWGPILESKFMARHKILAVNTCSYSNLSKYKEIVWNFGRDNKKILYGGGGLLEYSVHNKKARFSWGRVPS